MLKTVNDRQLIQLTLQEEFLYKQNVIISWNWVNILLSQCLSQSTTKKIIIDICRITFLSIYLFKISVTTNINVLKSCIHLILLIWVVFSYTSKPTKDNRIVLQYQEDTAKPAFVLVCASVIAVMHEWLWNYLTALFPKPWLLLSS